MENNKELKPNESFKIINEMIETAKMNIKQNAFYVLLWGWIVIIGCLLHFIFLKFSIIEKPYQVWLISIVGVVMTFIYSFKEAKRKKVFTHISKIYIFIWVTFAVSYIITIVFHIQFNYQIYPLIFLFGGNSIFLTGIVMKFKPLIFGGILFWIGCITSFYFTEAYNLLLTSIIGILGYLIPGYILKYKKD